MKNRYKVIIVIAMIIIAICCLHHINLICSSTDDYIACCGDPMDNPNITVECATLVNINDNEITFETEDGNLYAAYVNDPNNFSIDGYYCIFIDSNDIVVKAFVEEW